MLSIGIGIMSNRLIALFTDFGQRDAYVAQMKGAILTLNPQARLIDLNHEVDPFDIRGAAYLLEASARFMPAETIFVTVIDPGVGFARRPLLLQTQAGKQYVGPDNGLFTSVLDRQGLQAAYELNKSAYFREPQVSTTFHGRDIFGPVAAHLSLGVAPKDVGSPVMDPFTLRSTRPHWVRQTLVGEIRHIDHFGNVITNITRDDLEQVCLGELLTCTLGLQVYAVPFVRTYAEGESGELIALINSDDAFELAISQGSAAARVKTEIGHQVHLQLGVET
jgi:S-adenosylmethionine hydrolase